jgi:hypothetical protein
MRRVITEKSRHAGDLDEAHLAALERALDGAVGVAGARIQGAIRAVQPDKDAQFQATEERAVARRFAGPSWTLQVELGRQLRRAAAGADPAGSWFTEVFSVTLWADGPDLDAAAAAVGRAAGILFDGATAAQLARNARRLMG